MRRLLFFLLLLAATPGTGQEAIDYRAAAHWTGGVLLERGLTTPIVLDTRILVVDGTHQVRVVDSSDPYNPSVLPSVPLDEPVTRVFGPFAGYVYASGADHLFVIDATTLLTVASLDHPDVAAMVLSETVGALLVNGGSQLITVDPSEPTLLTALGGLQLSSSTRYWEHLSLRGTTVLVSRSCCSTILAFDVSDPATPVAQSQFGWYEMPKSDFGYEYSIQAISADSVYSLEHKYYYNSSGYDFETNRGYVTRWDLSDETNPRYLDRLELWFHGIHELTSHYALDGQELIVVQGSHLISVDLQDPELDSHWVTVGLGGRHRICGLAMGGGILAICAEDGSLHLAKSRQPGSTRPTTIAGYRPGFSALGPDRFLTVNQDIYRYFFLSFQVFDSTDPDNLMPLEEERWLSTDHVSGGTLAPNYDVLFDPELWVRTHEPGARYSRRGDAHDFEIIGPQIGALADNGGLTLLNTSNPDDFTELARVHDRVCLDISLIPGQTGPQDLIAVRDSTRQTGVWDIATPESPRLMAQLEVELDDLVDVGGGPGRILAGLIEGSPEWPGFTLQLFDLTPPEAPRTAGRLKLPGRAREGWLMDDKLYLACDVAGLVVVDIGNLDAPFIHGGFGSDPVDSIRLEGGRLLLGGANLFVLGPDASHPESVLVNAFTATPQLSGVQLDWQLDGNWSTHDFRLMVVERNDYREVPFTLDGSHGSALDSEWICEESTFQLEHRPAGQESWTVLAQRSLGGVALMATDLTLAATPTGVDLSWQFIGGCAGMETRLVAQSAGPLRTVPFQTDGQSGFTHDDGWTCEMTTYFLQSRPLNLDAWNTLAQATSPLGVVEIEDFKLSSNSNGVDLEWRLLSRCADSTIRLLALENGWPREVPFETNGDHCSAHDEDWTWGETTYQLVYRTLHEKYWTLLAEESSTFAEPEATQLLPPFPNPFNASVDMTCETLTDGLVQIRILDISGRLVRELLSEYRTAGRHRVNWDGLDNRGRAMASGTYLVEFTAADGSGRRKLLMVR